MNKASRIVLDPYQGQDRPYAIPDWIFSELWHRIVTLTLAPGAKITEEGLAEDLEVSRTPMREALRRLLEAGLVVRQRNRALRVAPLSVDEVIELAHIRERMEALVARNVAVRVRDEKVSTEPVRRVLRQMEALKHTSQDTMTALRSGNEFHLALRALSNTPRVSTILSNIHFSLERYRYLLNENRDRLPDIIREHHDIIDAIDEGNPSKAEQAMCIHIARARALYVEEVIPLLNSQPDLQST